MKNKYLIFFCVNTVLILATGYFIISPMKYKVAINAEKAGYRYIHEGKYDTSIKCFETSLKNYSLPLNRSRILKYIAYNYYKSGNLEKALLYINKSLKIENSDYEYYSVFQWNYNIFDYDSKRIKRNELYNIIEEKINEKNQQI